MKGPSIIFGCVIQHLLNDHACAGTTPYLDNLTPHRVAAFRAMMQRLLQGGRQLHNSKKELKVCQITKLSGHAIKYKYCNVRVWILRAGHTGTECYKNWENSWRQEEAFEWHSSNNSAQSPRWQRCRNQTLNIWWDCRGIRVCPLRFWSLAPVKSNICIQPRRIHSKVWRWEHISRSTGCGSHQHTGH